MVCSLNLNGLSHGGKVARISTSSLVIRAVVFPATLLDLVDRTGRRVRDVDLTVLVLSLNLALLVSALVLGLSFVSSRKIFSAGALLDLCLGLLKVCPVNQC